jgi:hypothetical protein
MSSSWLEAWLGIVAAQMDEHEAYTNLSEALGIAEAACRQLAFMRAESEGCAVAADGRYDG